jgi:hypothetical protein
MTEEKITMKSHHVKWIAEAAIHWFETETRKLEIDLLLDQKFGDDRPIPKQARSRAERRKSKINFRNQYSMILKFLYEWRDVIGDKMAEEWTASVRAYFVDQDITDIEKEGGD